MNAVERERFWTKVDKTDSCWNWTAAKSTAGYGQLSVAGKIQYAHRLAFSERYGDIPEGKVIDHACHNRGCVNIDHLRLVTRAQNNQNHTGARSDSRSGVRGVSWSKVANKWLAQVKENGKTVHIGYFTDLSEAGAAVTAKRNELFTHNDIDRRQNFTNAVRDLTSGIPEKVTA